MKIGIDASCWANQRGYGRYTRELLRTLLSSDKRNEYRIAGLRPPRKVSHDAIAS